MKDHNSRDHPCGHSLLDGFGTLIIVLTVMAVIGIFSSLLQAMDFGVTDGGKDDQIFDNTADDDNTEEPPSIEEPPEEEPPEEDPPIEEPVSDGRGTGLYASHPDVLNFEVENDHIFTNLTSSDYNWSKPVIDRDNPCWEIGKANNFSNVSHSTQFFSVEFEKSGFVFETDLKWMGTSNVFLDQVSSPWIFKIDFYESPERSVFIFGYINENGDLCLSHSSGHNSNIITIPRDAWVNLRIVINENNIEFYLNNELSNTIDLSLFMTDYIQGYSNFEFVKFELRYCLKDIQIRLDNIFASAIDY